MLLSSRKIFITFILCCLSVHANAQIVTSGLTPIQAVEDVLLGAGVNAFNITYNGSAANANISQGNVQEFDASGTTFPLEEGVLMSTNGPMLNDADLATLTGGSYTNGAIVEFDFVPSGDTLSFNYIFASTEYTSFTCSQFNDVFAFLLSGPGINGTFTNNAINIATVPGTNVPVAINTVNSGTPSGGNAGPCIAADPNWQANSVFFTLANNSLFQSSNTPMNSFNGSTVVLPANADLTCGDTFHIKLVIANDVDTGLDSGVFLEANSFSSGTVDISIGSETSTIDTLLVEGCTEGTIYFTRPENQTADSLVVIFSTGGTAIEGDDYPPLSASGDSVIFLPGEDSITLTINPIQDGLTEGFENVIISAFTVTACGDTIVSSGMIWFGDEPFSEVTSLDTTILCANDSVPTWVNTTGGFEPYTYEWSNGEVGDTVPTAGITNGETEYIVTSTDACGFEYQDTATITLNQNLSIDTLIQFMADCGLQNGAVSGDGSGFTGTPNYLWSNSPDLNSSGINATVYSDLPSGWYYFSITDDVCTVQDSIFLEQTPPPNASFTANPQFGNVPFDVLFTNTSDPAETYNWDFGNGQTASVNDLSSQTSTYTEEGAYLVTLTVTDGNCSDQATQNILATLVLPLIYDMPNVFTPNNDGINDVFRLNEENAVSLDLVILNRWGNVVFETKTIGDSWNGQVNNDGPECTDGSYFYKFTITGENGVAEEQHGFVQLVRDTEGN